MPSASRLLGRLRQQALRWYEVLLCAMLLGMALSVAASAQDGEEAAVQCGNSQSSTVVMQR